MLPIDGVLTSRIATLGVKALCRGNARHLVRGRLLRREACPVWRRKTRIGLADVLGRVTMQFFVREHCTMIAAPVQCDVDGIPKGSHCVSVMPTG